MECFLDMEPKNLADVSKEEQITFLKSFDHIMFDMDGVLWVASGTFPTSAECIANLKERGKTVRYVTNNPISSCEHLCKKLVREGFNAEVNDVVNPIISVVSYLKDINFNRKLFVTGAKVLKEELRKANFKVAPDPPLEIEDSLTEILKFIVDDEDIGAVIFSFDVNQSYIKLQKILTYLKRNDCLFLALCSDRDGPVGPLGPAIACEHFYRLLMDFSGREPVFVGKPSTYFADLVTKKFGITEARRALFVGDQINPDMHFATLGGYQKLLVLTGMTTIEDINDWRFPEEYKPEYYIESLDILNNILKSTK